MPSSEETGSECGSVSGVGANKSLRKNAPGNKSDVGWLHGYEIPGSNRKNRCKYCDKIVSGGVYRLKHHLAGTKKDTLPCPFVHEDVKRQMLDILVRRLEESSNKKKYGLEIGSTDVDDMEVMEENACGKRKGKGKEDLGLCLFKRKTRSTQSTINQMCQKVSREDVCQQIARFFYTSGIPFHCVKNPEFFKMCQLIGEYGIGLKLLSYHELGEKYLKQEVARTDDTLEEHKAKWKKTGCSIMLGGPTDKKRRFVCNFLVNSMKGTVFLSSADVSGISSAEKLFEMLDAIVEEIGEENVVQVVSYNDAKYEAAGELLMQKRKQLYWTPCVARCIDSILEDLEKEEKVHHLTIQRGRKITSYIYSRALLITMLKHFNKGKILVKRATSRFTANYQNLGLLRDNKHGLLSMFTSDEWKSSQFAKTDDGKNVEHIVLDSRFWRNIATCLNAAQPLIKALDMADSNEKPAMGFIYEEMNSVKQEIKANFNNVKRSYENIWKIIDKGWEGQLLKPLHYAAYYLNPKFHYSPNFNPNREVKRGLYSVIERMVPNVKERDIIDLQLEEFKHARGSFGWPRSVKSMRDKKAPADWWDSYGYDTPELQKFAVRILSLTASSSRYVRNRSTVEMVHMKRRNRLHQEKMKDLVFVMHNLKLERKIRNISTCEVNDDNDDDDDLDVSSDDEWIVEEEDVDSSKMILSNSIGHKEAEEDRKR